MNEGRDPGRVLLHGSITLLIRFVVDPFSLKGWSESEGECEGLVTNVVEETNKLTG